MDGWTIDKQLVGVIRMEAEVVLRVSIIKVAWRGHVVHYVRVLIKELLEASSRDMLYLMLKDLVHRVALVLKHVYQIHYLLLSQLLIRDFICKSIALPLNISILLN